MAKIFYIFMIVAINVLAMEMDDDPNGSNDDLENSYSYSIVGLDSYREQPHNNDGKKVTYRKPIHTKLPKSKSFKKKNHVGIPLSLIPPSDDQIFVYIINGDVKQLKTIKEIPNLIKDKAPKYWAKEAGHDNLAKALNPKTIGKKIYLKSAKKSAPQIISTRNKLFFGANYGDLPLVENTKKDWHSSNHNPINEDGKSLSTIASERGYERLAVFLSHGKDLDDKTRATIIEECMAVNKELIKKAPPEEKANFLSWEFSRSSDLADLIHEQFNDTFFAWLYINEFKFHTRQLNEKQKKFTDVPLIFNANTWNLMDRKKLLASTSELSAIKFTEQESQVQDEKIKQLFVNFIEGKGPKISDAIKILDEAITNGANLDYKFATKNGPRTAAEWINDIGLTSLTLPLTNKFLWFLYDKKKMEGLLSADYVAFNCKNAF